MADVQDTIREALAKLDWAKPDGKTPEGRSFYRVKVRERFSIPAREEWEAERVTRTTAATARRATRSTPPAGGPDAARAQGEQDAYTDDGAMVDAPVPMIEGIASSTSRDWYGTEMSEAALRAMAARMGSDGGIPILPRHFRGWDALEWDETIGRTVGAVVLPAKQVADAAVPGEPQFILRATSCLYAEEPKAQALLVRLDRMEPIGQSIGGWFTELRFIMDETGDDVERVIVESVELDHLAVTRAPANPDCADLMQLRSRVSVAARAVRPAPPVRAADVAVESRSVVPYQDLALADKEEAWGWTTETQDAVLGDADWARYKKVHVWSDPDKADSKDGYKLPIGRDFDGTLKCVWKAVTSAMGAVNGARGGLDISDDDRKACYDHLAKYYAKWDETAPEFKASVESEPEGEPRSRLDAAPVAVHSGEQQRPATDVDARRSALPENDPPAVADGPRGNSEERTTMPDPQPTTLTPEVIRTMLAEALAAGLAPVLAKVEAIEQRAAAPAPAATPTAPAPAPAAAAPAAIDWEARSKAAEGALAAHIRGGDRQGRAMPLVVPDSPNAPATYDAICDAARAEGAIGFAATVRSALPVLLKKKMDSSESGEDSRSTLADNLCAVLRAAEDDGVITNPNARAVWG